VDPTSLGYGGVTLSAVGLGIAFWLLGLVLCALDRLPARRRRPVDQAA
jgi:hypothetical protein